MKKILSKWLPRVFLGFIAFIIISMSYLGYSSRSMPDVKTLQDNQLANCPETPNCVSSFDQEDNSHYITPITITPSRVAGIGEYFGARCKLIESSHIYWSYQCRSDLFGFVDDLELLYLEETSELHYRSASRVGKSDLGANRKRLEAFIHYLTK